MESCCDNLERSRERGDLVQELLDLEKFKGFKEGIATLFALAGFGMGVLAGSNKGDHQLRVSSGAFPAVVRAVAGLGKML